MKKFFTASALLAVALGASAITAPQMPADLKLELTPERAAVLQTKMAEVFTTLESGDETKVMHRDYRDPNGDLWAIAITNMGNEFWTMFAEAGSEAYDFFYDYWTCTPISLRRYQKDETDTKEDYQYFLVFWPTNKLIRESPGFPQPDDDLDDYAPYQMSKFIETGLPIEVLDEGGIGFKTDANNYITAYGVYYMNTLVADYQSGEKKPFYEWIGYESMYKGNICAPETGYSVDIKGYDSGLSYLDVSFDGYLVNADGNRVGSFLLNYDGEGYVDGFEIITKTWEVADCHVVDTGVMDYDSMEQDFGFYFYDGEWGPVHRYYLMMCGKGLYWPEDAFEKESYPSFNSRLNDGPWLVTADTEADFNFFRGALYAAADAKDYGGVYTMYYPSIIQWLTMNLAKPGPSAGTCISGQFNKSILEFANVDGLLMGYKGYYAYPQEGTTIQTDTKEGLVIRGKDQFGDIITFSYKGNIYYHNDPKDFSKYEIISAVGEREVGIESVNAVKGNVVAANGEIAVTAEESAPVAIYNVNGMVIANKNLAAGETMTVKAAKGVYVVKVGQGVQKVVL